VARRLRQDAETSPFRAVLIRDAEDLERVAALLERGNVDAAEAIARRLDTALRDMIPAEVCRLFGWEALGRGGS
jgi:hypothetical protein